jgi:hypothetical protein
MTDDEATAQKVRRFINSMPLRSVCCGCGSSVAGIAYAKCGPGDRLVSTERAVEVNLRMLFSRPPEPSP